MFTVGCQGIDIAIYIYRRTIWSHKRSSNKPRGQLAFLDSMSMNDPECE